MKLRRFALLLVVALFAISSVANAAVLRVREGESIQEAIDDAESGDTILVEPGEYMENPGGQFGLRISTPNLRLIGKVVPGQGEAGKVRLVWNGEMTQRTGVYAAPMGCGPDKGVGECPDELQGFYIRGFTVVDFPDNGIQTRFVRDFTIIRNESVRNLENGLYPTISADGLVAHNVSYGSLDTALWPAASENVRVMRNELKESTIGLEITVSKDIFVRHNDIHDNTVGIGLFHANAAGNDPLPVIGNWVIEHNDVYDNNLPNPADPNTTFQGLLPPGLGIVLFGVSDNVVRKNTVENNDFVGIGVIGWCTATATTPRNCAVDPPIVGQDPSSNDNLVSQNDVLGNGGNPPGGPFAPIAFLAADLTYFTLGPAVGESQSGNCFEKNDFVTSVSSEPGGELPTDGC